MSITALIEKQESLTVKEVAEVLQRSTKTIYTWIKTGYIKPQMQIGKQYLFDKAYLSDKFKY